MIGLLVHVGENFFFLSKKKLPAEFQRILRQKDGFYGHRLMVAGMVVVVTHRCMNQRNTCAEENYNLDLGQ